VSLSDICYLVPVNTLDIAGVGMRILHSNEVHQIIGAHRGFVSINIGPMFPPLSPYYPYMVEPVVDVYEDVVCHHGHCWIERTEIPGYVPYPYF
jgi:hypothetical protein